MSRIDFLNKLEQLKGQQSTNVIKLEVPKFSTSQNTIFQQNYHIYLNNVDIEKIHQAITFLEKSRLDLMSAIASLEGFNGIRKNELKMAALYMDGYLHMFNEYLLQNRTGTKLENLTKGLAVQS